jgi:hypothetical protein
MLGSIYFLITCVKFHIILDVKLNLTNIKLFKINITAHINSSIWLKKNTTKTRNGDLFLWLMNS